MWWPLRKLKRDLVESADYVCFYRWKRCCCGSQILFSSPYGKIELMKMKCDVFSQWKWWLTIQRSLIKEQLNYILTCYPIKYCSLLLISISHLSIMFEEWFTSQSSVRCIIFLLSSKIVLKTHYYGEGIHTSGCKLYKTKLQYLLFFYSKF
jgi:hypothetical protein